MNAKDIESINSITEIDRIVDARHAELDRLTPGRRSAPHWTYNELSRIDTIREELKLLRARRNELRG